MDTYDLIGFDVDGTILNSKKNISTRTLDAVNRAAASGKIVILSTGRCTIELEKFEEELTNVRYFVCESGALVYDTREKCILHSETLPPDVVERVLDISTSEDVMVYLMSAGVPFANRNEVSNVSRFHMSIYQDLMNHVVNKTDDIIAFYRSAHLPVEKLNLFSASTDIREWLYARIRGLPLSIVYADETSLELTPLHISKASGLTWLCQYLRIPLDRTVIVGDADNDAEALRIAGLSVAMGNALPHIKELCDVVVADNDHDGCAEVIERYLMK